MLGCLSVSILGVISLLYFGNSLLTKQSNTLIDAKAQNQALEKQELALIKAKKDISKYQNLEEITQKIVPTDKDQARATREIVALAQKNGFNLKTVTFPSSNLGSKPAKSNQSQNKDESQTQTKAENPNPISQAVHKSQKCLQKYLPYLSFSFYSS